MKDKKLILNIRLMQTYDERIWFSVLSTAILQFSLVKMDFTVQDTRHMSRYISIQKKKLLIWEEFVVFPPL